MGKKLEKSEKSSLVGVDFGEFVQGYGGIYKYKGSKKDPHGPVQGTVRIKYHIKRLLIVAKVSRVRVFTF